MHLGYHANRYGTIAIGFHRDRAIRHGFQPVFYQLENSPILREIYADLRRPKPAEALILNNKRMN